MNPATVIRRQPRVHVEIAPRRAPVVVVRRERTRDEEIAAFVRTEFKAVGAVVPERVVRR